MTLGEMLCRLRAEAGFTQEELAEVSGLSVRAISDIERGRSTRPYQSSLRLLVVALRLPTDVASQLFAMGRSAQVSECAKPALVRLVEPEPVPHQLPLRSRWLHGRHDDLVGLASWLDRAVESSLVVSLVGPGGVGKTALAVEWAHHVRDRFPGGELYVNMRGFQGADELPLSATAALDSLLRALGVQPDAIPDDEETRSGLYRSVTGERKVLVLLDNARNAAQVRNLLAGAGCLTIITSRNQMRSLVVQDGAHRATVRPLKPDAAMSVFRDAIDRGADDCPAQIRELVDHCGGLPLALRIVAERVARDDSPLDALVGQMRNQTTRLDAMNADDDDLTNIRAILACSYHALASDAARAFDLLGTLPGTEFDDGAAAAAFGRTYAEAARLLDNLIAFHLLEQPRPGRYQLHDVVRTFAAERATMITEPTIESHSTGIACRNRTRCPSAQLAQSRPRHLYVSR